MKEKIYHLPCVNPNYLHSDYLCISLDGFEELWNDFLGKGAEETSITGLFMELTGTTYFESLGRADALRARIKSMVPCSITLKQFEELVLFYATVDLTPSTYQETL